LSGKNLEIYAMWHIFNSLKKIKIKTESILFFVMKVYYSDFTFTTYLFINFAFQIEH